MKVLTILFAAWLMMAMYSVKSDNKEPSFCDCWKEGYKDGWCLDQNSAYTCLGPSTVPLCPMPRFDQNDCKSGYNLGVIRGRKDYENK